MHISKLFDGTFAEEEIYFKQIHDQHPMIYNDPLYSFFGHHFTSTLHSSSNLLNAIPEQSNRIFSTPLPEISFEKLHAANSCNVVFSRHLRYVPSRFHAHEYFEIVYQHRGVSNHNINGREFQTKTGDLIILPPLTFHSVCSPYDDSIVINIGVKMSNFKDYYGDFLQIDCVLSSFFKNCLNGKKSEDYVLIETEPPSVVSDVILNALMIQENSSGNNNFSVPGYLQASAFQLFSLLFMYYADKCKAMPYVNRNTNTLVGIMYYLKNNYKDVDLQKLAYDFHFTEPYLSRMIKSGTGHTFTELLSRVRLNTSLLLLENTLLPIADIANLVGYKAPENYMRNFKSVYGVTPTNYRKAKTNLKRTASP